MSRTSQNELEKLLESLKNKDEDNVNMAKDDAKNFILGLLVLFGVYMLYTGFQLFLQTSQIEIRVIVALGVGSLFVIIPSIIAFSKSKK